MLNLNRHTKTKYKPKPTCKFTNYSHVCAYHSTFYAFQCEKNIKGKLQQS